MATLKYIIRSKTSPANIYVRYSISKTLVLQKKTGYIIDPKEWHKDPKKGEPIQKTPELKSLKLTLDKMALFINDAYNRDIGQGATFGSDWLGLQIDLFNNKIPVIAFDVLTNYIQKYIDEAPFKQNAKKSLGLSKGRVQNLKLFKNTVLKYEAEVLNGISIIIRDINLSFIEKYKSWMFKKGYTANYVGKNIANFRTICLDAERNDIEISSQVKNIKSISEQKEPEDIIFLTEEEQEAIKSAPLEREALINARKWLLLGCLIGQRGGDLLNITAKNIKSVGEHKIIELKQQKTGKLVAIPLLPKALEIINSGLPYHISLTRFNEYIKDVCEAAQLNTPTSGREKLNNNSATIKGIFPKYKLVSSHICRRSFATNFYGHFPTPLLMSLTAHGTERMFLQYIGKTTYDNAYQMIELFAKYKPDNNPS